MAGFGSTHVIVDSVPAGAATSAAQTTAQANFTNIENLIRIDQADILRALLIEMKVISFLLKEGFSLRDDVEQLRRDISIDTPIL